MSTLEFIDKLKDSLEIEDQHLTIDSNLKELDVYDSLAVLSLIVLIDENFHKKLTTDQFNSITTISSLMEMVGKENFVD